MEAYATALSYAIPGFVVLIIIEQIAARMMGKHINRGMDVISSLSSGMTNTLTSLLGLSVVIVSYQWMEARLGIFDIQSSVLLYVLAFIGIDFAGYWSHRFNHSVNLFWNRHVVHHSSEEFNLSCALRQEISAIVGIYFFLYIPLAILGVPPKIIAVVAPLHLFAQFWYHTRLIGHMGFLEHIIVTPSHHRVHHAINEIYLDKNLSQVFIVWDKLFGTFQQELSEEPPIYGTLTPANTWNPIIINWMHAWKLCKDAWHAHSWWDKLRIWFMPLGWRPDDVKVEYPIELPGVYDRIKYEPYASAFLKSWSWFQFVIANLMVYHLLISFGSLSATQVAWYAGFLFVTIFSFTTLMDRRTLAIPIELVRLTLGIGIILQSGTWFGIESYLAGATTVMIVYLVASMLLTLYFTLVDEAPQAAV
ncbi:MAG: sterol desaturase family protein [Pirellulaceae bacterium]|nr:sterol desaturase family protein [Pirellulaceae bacterium]